MINQPFPRNHDYALGIMAKEPLPGQVKTRLTPPFSPTEAALIYHCSLAETVVSMTTCPCDCILFYAGDETYFHQNFPDTFRVRQANGSLGTRIDHALSTLLAAGYPAAALMGSDSPDLPRQLVIDAFTKLSTKAAVTIPATDGGYILIGEQQHCPGLFLDIPWSSPKVMAATRKQAELAGIHLEEVGEWEDFDDATSLQRLTVRSPHSATARLVLCNFSHLLERETMLPYQATAVAGKDQPVG